VKIQLAVFATVKRTSHVDQVLGVVGINAPVAVFVGFRQRASGDTAGQSEVIEFLLIRPKFSMLPTPKGKLRGRAGCFADSVGRSTSRGTVASNGAYGLCDRLGSESRND